MRFTGLYILMGLICLCCACGGGTDNAADGNMLALQAMHGTDAARLTLQMKDGNALVDIEGLDEQGVFFELAIPQGMQPARLSWSDASGGNCADSLLTISRLEESGLQVGAVPAGDSGIDSAVLKLELEAASGLRLAGAVDDELSEEVLDLVVMDHDPFAGNLLLSWPAWLPGDYDLSGFVGIQDITPLGKHYGTQHQAGLAWPHSDPLHYVDGNADGIVNASDISVIGQHFGEQLVGFRLYYGDELHEGMDESLLNLQQGEAQGAGLPRRHFLHLANIDDPSMLELRAVTRRSSTNSGNGNPDLEVHISINGMEVVDNGEGLKAGTRVIKPIEDVAGQREIVSEPEHENGQLASFRGIPRGRDFLLDVVYEPLTTPFGSDFPDTPGVQGGPGNSVVTSVPFRLPQLYSRSVMTIDIEYMQLPSGSYMAQLNARIDHEGGSQEYSALLDFAGGILRRDSNNDGNFGGELEFVDTDRDCVSDQLISEIYGTSNSPEENYIHGVFDGPLESIDYLNSVITMSQESTQFWSDGVERNDRIVRFSENAEFIGFGSIQHLSPGDFVHIEMLRLESDEDLLADVNWAEYIHALDQNFSEYWIAAELQENDEFAAISTGRGNGPLDDSYAQYLITVRSENSGDYMEFPLGEVGTGFTYVLLLPGNIYTISLIGYSVDGSAPTLLADTVVFVDPERFWDGFGEPPGNPAGGPGND